MAKTVEVELLQVTFMNLSQNFNYRDVMLMQMCLYSDNHEHSIYVACRPRDKQRVEPSVKSVRRTSQNTDVLLVLFDSTSAKSFELCQSLTVQLLGTML
jgi:hypothetical protein